MTSPHSLLAASNLRARKELGQNFLKEPSVAERIVASADIGEEDGVLEIGPGLGAMTVAAGRRSGRLIAVEKDRLLVPVLKTQLAAQGLARVEVIEGDILSLSLRDLAANAGGPLIVLGNLPYNISSQVVVKLVQERAFVRRAVLMFQKELAERLCAPPGNKVYGRLSVLLQYCAETKVLHRVRADQFFPRPKVDSVVLGIVFKTSIEPRVGDETLFVRVVQAAFGQRRKTLRNALSAGLLPMGGDDTTAVLQQAGIEPRRRAETLSVEEFVRLTDVIDSYLSSKGLCL
jgi:16S rRNA (adenine1518-N6/adenine1519-N6)-dimethyltransferase